jgi:hypothetical protein
LSANAKPVEGTNGGARNNVWKNKH